MNFHDASVADILRCHQRDALFVSDLESQLHNFFKGLGVRTYHRMRNSVPVIANSWYYFMTSFGNLQTLGEEYTGTIRVNQARRVPSSLQQLMWLLVYIGGEPLLERALTHVKMKLRSSPSLTQHSKDILVNCVDCFKEHKPMIKRIHQSLFYIHSKYYYIANRLLGIKYVLLRDWMQNESFSGNFQILGRLSLFYIMFSLVQKCLNPDLQFSNRQNIPSTTLDDSTKMCILCVDYLKNSTATPCGHIFCWDCLHDSLSYQKVCPICREEVLPSRVIFLQNYL